MATVAATMGGRLWRLEWLLLAAATPLLLFPRDGWPWVGLGLAVVGWLLRALSSGRWMERTPLDRPLFVLFVMVLVGLFASVDLSLSMPKFYGIMLGLFAFYATVAHLDRPSLWRLAVWMLAVSVVPVSLVGLVGTQWSRKLQALGQVYQYIPRLIGEVQTSQMVTSGLNPNEVAGTLAFLLPLPIGLLLLAPVSRRQRLGLALGVLLGLGVLILSASRSAFLGLGLGLLTLVIWRWRRLGFSVLLVAGVAVAAVLVLYGETVSDLFLAIDAAGSGTGSLAVRMEIWHRALLMIADFPFTGIGLNTFPLVVERLYPLFLIPVGTPMPHAHNVFLQAAIDYGLGGLLAFLALWASAGMVGWRALRLAREEGSPPSKDAVAVAGLMAGLLAYLVAGLTDVITLGAKPTLLLWLMLGLLVAGARRSASQHRPLHEDGASQSWLGTARQLLGGVYWTVTFFLMFLGLVVVGISLSGWAP